MDIICCTFFESMLLPTNATMKLPFHFRNDQMCCVATTSAYISSPGLADQVSAQSFKQHSGTCCTLHYIRLISQRTGMVSARINLCAVYLRSRNTLGTPQFCTDPSDSNSSSGFSNGTGSSKLQVYSLGKPTAPNSVKQFI